MARSSRVGWPRPAGRGIPRQNPVFGPDFDTMKIRNRPAVQAGRFFSIIPHFYRCPNKFQANQKCGRKKPSQPNGTVFYIKTKNPGEKGRDF
ncbi:MAG: hypothetical protein SPJ01_02565 [Butyricicoccus sp.]|nr:hypothetical protein [Butyricicoccus pullicaecorum]MDY5971747.1 hypothetical protein [Butyricicoccus sp.]